MQKKLIFFILLFAHSNSNTIGNLVLLEGSCAYIESGNAIKVHTHKPTIEKVSDTYEEDAQESGDESYEDSNSQQLLLDGNQQDSQLGHIKQVCAFTLF